ncbi:MAG: RidA family protein [Chromatiales bacterium]|nr:RidA family protein [Chromatiales bacterium]
MNKEVISTKEAPAAIGTYSQAIRAGELVFVSGQIPLDPQTGDLVGPDIEDQIHQVFRNLEAVAQAAGSDLGRAVKLTIFLTDLANFARVNEIMAQYVPEPYPARAAVGVVALPRGAGVEADAILLA